MQDRYVGDIGDYIKLSLLRRLCKPEELGIAWYLTKPQDTESKNGDGKHTKYFDNHPSISKVDEELFNGLRTLVSKNNRTVLALQDTNLIGSTFNNELLEKRHLSIHERANWFEDVISSLKHSTLIFADPDNGLTEGQTSNGMISSKHITIDEVNLMTSNGRPAVLYHHNTRYKDGHECEVNDWINKLGTGTIAVRANAYSARTFFIKNATEDIRSKVEEFVNMWRDFKNQKKRRHIWLHGTTR